MIVKVPAAVAGLALLWSAAVYRLPPESPIKLGEDAEADLVVANCSGCHSLDYITHQAPAMGPAFWTAEVNKMRTVYGAPTDEADASRIAAYLAHATGGKEQPNRP